MTEEVKDQEPKDEIVDEVVVDPVEEQAKEQGWVTKEEWVAQGKDEKDHRTAKEFVERGELYKSIHSTKRELLQAKAALDSLSRHHQYVYEKAFQDADKKLRQEMRAAVREGDHDAVDQIEQERAQLHQEHQAKVTAFQREQAMAASFAQVPPELDAWMARNPWYNNDVDMRFDADAEGQKYLVKGGTREGLLAHVEKKMKERFPEKFGIVKRKAASSPVSDPSTRGTRRTTVAEEAGLSELETKIMNDLVKSGVMTKEQYIKELKGAK
jgi:hypothetical protein